MRASTSPGRDVGVRRAFTGLCLQHVPAERCESWAWHLPKSCTGLHAGMPKGTTATSSIRKMTLQPAVDVTMRVVCRGHQKHLAVWMQSSRVLICMWPSVCPKGRYTTTFCSYAQQHRLPTYFREMQTVVQPSSSTRGTRSTAALYPLI